MKTFATAFQGFLATETMLIRGLNDGEDIVSETAEFVADLGPRKAYLSVPTRPPTEAWCEPPDETRFNAAYQMFAEWLPEAECLTSELETGFGSTGAIDEDILAITSVHPMTEGAMKLLLRDHGATWAAVARLVDGGLLKQVPYRGRTFYVRRLPLGKDERD